MPAEEQEQKSKKICITIQRLNLIYWGFGLVYTYEELLCYIDNKLLLI